MPELPILPPSVETVLRVTIVIVAALVSMVVLRQAVRIGVRNILARRAAEAEGADDADASAAAPELERRVNTIARLVVRVGAATIAIIAMLMILGQFNIDVGPAVAGLGVVGIAVGFGAQTLIRDWLAGIFVVLENQYSEGDVVRIAGVEGVVEAFSLRRTTLRDLDGTVHTVPNGQITVASNLTRLWARVNLDVNVAYDTDIDRATALINRVGDELQADPEWGPRLLEAPRVVRVSAFAASAVTLKVLGQVRAAEQWAVGGELRKRILAAFSREGIEIPFPHQVMITRASGGPVPTPRAADPAEEAPEEGPDRTDAGPEPDPTAPVGPER